VGHLISKVTNHTLDGEDSFPVRDIRIFPCRRILNDSNSFPVSCQIGTMLNQLERGANDSPLSSQC
jgi:hypothetical protein